MIHFVKLLCYCFAVCNAVFTVHVHVEYICRLVLLYNPVKFDNPTVYFHYGILNTVGI